MALSLQPAELPDDAVEVGFILGAWGVQGWLKLTPHSASAEALLAAKQWFLLPPDQARLIPGFDAFSGAVSVDVSAIKPHGAAWVAQLSGLDDRNASQALRGARIFLSRRTFPALTAHEYYWVDLIGLQVVNREGLVLGQVHDLLSTGPHAVLCVQHVLADGAQGERLIPFVAAYVDHVDLVAKRITVDWQPDY